MRMAEILELHPSADEMQLVYGTEPVAKDKSEEVMGTARQPPELYDGYLGVLDFYTNTGRGVPTKYVSKDMADKIWKARNGRDSTEVTCLVCKERGIRKDFSTAAKPRRALYQHTASHYVYYICECGCRYGSPGGLHKHQRSRHCQGRKSSIVSKDLLSSFMAKLKATPTKQPLSIKSITIMKSPQPKSAAPSKTIKTTSTALEERICSLEKLVHDLTKQREEDIKRMEHLDRLLISLVHPHYANHTKSNLQRYLHK